VRQLAARTLQVNGMYRHGYMIAPAMHDVVLDILEGGTSARAAEFDLSMQLL
jgi:glycine oxidase